MIQKIIDEMSLWPVGDVMFMGILFFVFALVMVGIIILFIQGVHERTEEKRRMIISAIKETTHDEVDENCPDWANYVRWCQTKI